MDLKLYTIDSQYIDFLRSNPKLSNVFENKDDLGSFARKYLGLVFTIGEYKYYAPLSSPKPSDYIFDDGEQIIRKSIVPIIRIVSDDKFGKPELKGTIKLSNMIPVPDDVIFYYDISKETDEDYKILVEKEYDFIRRNKSLILKNAYILYNQKTRAAEFFPVGRKKPGYLNSVIDFKYAEEVFRNYILK